MGIVNSTPQTCTYPLPPEQVGSPIQNENKIQSIQSKVYNTYETSNERKNHIRNNQIRNQQNQKIGNTIPLLNQNKNSSNVLTSSSNIQINQMPSQNIRNQNTEIKEEEKKTEKMIGEDGEEVIETTKEEEKKNEAMEGGKKIDFKGMKKDELKEIFKKNDMIITKNGKYYTKKQMILLLKKQKNLLI